MHEHKGMGNAKKQKMQVDTDGEKHIKMIWSLQLEESKQYNLWDPCMPTDTPEKSGQKSSLWETCTQKTIFHRTESQDT